MILKQFKLNLRLKNMQRTLIIILLFLFQVKFSYPQKDTLTLLLMHPTVKNVNSIAFLLDNKIIPLSIPYKIIGVYHEKSIYDYTKTINYLKKEKNKVVELYGVKKNISEDSIFTQNQLFNDFEKLFEMSDGVIFTGGPDIPPNIYKDKTLLTTLIEDPYRHYFEISFLAHLLGTSRNKKIIPLLNKKPFFTVLGICLGMQSMNVAAGGTLLQDIPSQLYNLKTINDVLTLPTEKIHDNYFEKMVPVDGIFWGTLHPITIDNKNKLFGEFSKPVYVVSAHHQSIQQLAESYEITAFSIDKKIPEMIIHKKFKNVIGVQFHPEVTALYTTNQSLKLNFDTTQNIIFSRDYAGEKGMQFHYEFWKIFGKMLEESWNNKK